MNLTLYKYLGERNRVDKENYLIKVLETSGKFKADVSILNPVLLLSLPLEEEQELTDEQGNEIDDVVIYNGIGIPLDFNYIYITEFRRFYYVNSIVYGSNKLTTIGCEVDPLMSFKGQILANEALVARNELTYDKMLADSIMPFLEDHEIIYRDMSTSGSLVNFSFNVETSGIGTKNFIIGLLQDVSSQWYEAYEPSDVDAPSGTGLPNISARRRSEGLTNSVYYAISYSSLKSIAKDVFHNDTKQSFVISCVAVPFNVTQDLGRSADVHEVLINNERILISAGTYLNETFYVYGSESKYFVIADETFDPYDSYLDLNPYTRVTFYLPYYGNVEISYERIAGKRIIVYYTMNAGTGEGSVNIYNVTDGVAVFQASCALGLRLSLNVTNELELTNARNANSLNAALGMIGGVLSMAGGFAMGNPIAVGAGALSMTQTGAGSILKEMNMLERANVATPSTNAGAHLIQNVKITIIKSKPRYKTALELGSYAHQYGRPLNQIRTLSSLSGFTQVASIHLEGCTATDAEKRMIVSSLLQGVHL